MIGFYGVTASKGLRESEEGNFGQALRYSINSNSKQIIALSKINIHRCL